MTRAFEQPDVDVVTVVAVDLGASSGRVLLARVGPSTLELAELHRFDNGPVQQPGGLYWDVVELYEQILVGLRAATAALAPGEQIASIGIDTWAVDMGFLDESGELVSLPRCYRDPDHQRGVDWVHARMSAPELYARNGVQHQPFTSMFQLAAARTQIWWPAVRCALLLPDLFGYWLTGERVAEATNASTTGLLDVVSRRWSPELVGLLELGADVLPPLVRPGERIGVLTAQVAAQTGLPQGTPVLAVGSHDTASAVVAVPSQADGSCYISSGTWSLVGIEQAHPVIQPAGAAANFTNEGGVDLTIRYQKNVMGLWLLQESLREWGMRGDSAALEQLLGAAGALPPGGAVINVDLPVFLPPGDMPARISEQCLASGQPVPTNRHTLVRVILDSLAAAYSGAVDACAQLTGTHVDTVYVVGGGSRNALLAQLTADACGRPVVTGPAEATGLGNALVQARALGVFGSHASLATLRELVVATQPLQRYAPHT